MAQGFDGYLPKPLIISDLIELMRHLTGGAAPSAAAGTPNRAGERP